MTDRVPVTNLYNKLLPVVQSVLDSNPAPTAGQIIQAVLGIVAGSQRNKVTVHHLAQSQNLPVCGICGLRIYLDVDPNDDSALSLDHIIRRADGGNTTIENTRLVHRLCNETRQVFDEGRQPTRRVLLSMKVMKEEIQARDHGSLV